MEIITFYLVSKIHYKNNNTNMEKRNSKWKEKHFNDCFKIQDKHCKIQNKLCNILIEN